MFVDLLTVPGPRQGFLCAHASSSRQEGWGTRAQGTLRALGFPCTPSILGFPFGLVCPTLGSSRALGGGEVINLEPCGGSLLRREPGWERKFLPSRAEGCAEAGLGALGFVEAPFAACVRRGVVSQALEAPYAKGRSIVMSLPFLSFLFLPF